MKYFGELSNLETQIIRLDVLESLVRALVTTMPDCDRMDTENIMWHLHDQVEEIHAGIREQFNFLFETIKEETHETKKRKR